MIRWPHADLPADVALRLEEVQTGINGIVQYSERVARAKDSWSRKNRGLFRRVRDVLVVMCSGAQRCAYCEDSAADEIEHIYPKDLYPERVFRWTNYVFACGPCNGPKNSKFAITANGNLVSISRPRNAPVVPPMAGDATMLDPRVEEPMEFLSIDLET